MAAVVLATISERFNIIWYPTVVALHSGPKGIGGVWVGWWIFCSNLSSWVVCGLLTGNFTKLFPAEIAAYWLLNLSAIILGIFSLLFGLIGYLPRLPFNVGNFISALVRGSFSAVVTVAVNTVIIMEFKTRVETLKMYTGLAYTLGCVLSILVSYAVYQVCSDLFYACVVTSILSLLIILPVYLTMPKRSTQGHTPSQDSTTQKVVAVKTSVCSDLNSANPLKTAQALSVSLNSLSAAHIESTTEHATKNNGSWSTAMALCKVPEIFLALLCQMVVFSGLSAHGPLHSPFLQQVFQLESIQIGLVSCTPFLAMATGSFFFGIIGKSLAGRKVSLIGCLFLIATSSMIEGPDPAFCSLPQSLYLHVLSLFISAFAFSSHLVLTAEEMRHAALVHGFPESISVYGAIASLLGASEYASGLLGPLFGGYLGQSLGFERTLGLMGVLCAICGVVRLVVLARQDKLYANFSNRSKSHRLSTQETLGHKEC